jgi:cytoskeletal protein CcmA (bactofilin family)
MQPYFLRTIGYLAFFLLFVFPSVLQAAPVIRTGDTISLKEDQSIPGDFYTFGGSVTNAARVGGDTYVIAGTVTQNGDITADLSGLVGQLEVHAPVGDDVRIAGGRVVIASKVAGDVVMVGGELVITSTAEIEGDVLFYGGVLSIEGTVKGSVLARAETIRVDARIGKDISVTAANELVLGAHADVGGNVRYTSSKEAMRAIDSVVVGSITRDDTFPLTKQSSGPSLMPLLMLLFAGLVGRFVFNAHITQVLERTNSSFGHAALTGFAVVILVPVAILLLLVSILGIIPGLLLLFWYLLSVGVACALSGMFLGGFLSKYVTSTASYSPLWITLGTTLFYALTFLPVVGHILTLVVVLMVLGGFATRAYEHYR